CRWLVCVIFTTPAALSHRNHMGLTRGDPSLATVAKLANRGRSRRSMYASGGRTTLSVLIHSGSSYRVSGGQFTALAYLEDGSTPADRRSRSGRSRSPTSRLVAAPKAGN